MKTSRLALLALAAGGSFAAKRAFDAEVRSWSTNPDPTDGAPLRLPAGETVEVTADDGATLRGFRCGDAAGPSIVLVHGYIEHTGFFAPVVTRLADAGFDVVVVDQRGHGRSDRGVAAYTTATLGADLARWLVELDLTGATVVGHSMGGVAAMAFAADHGDVARDHVHHLVLVATLAEPTAVSATLPQIDPARGVESLTHLFRRPDLGLLALRGVFGTRPTRSGLEATRAGFLQTDPTTRVDAVRMLRDFDLRPSLRSIAVPTRVVAGSHDRLTPLALNEAIAEGIPDAQLDVLPGIGHMIMFEAPEVLTDLIVQSTKPTDRVA